MKREELEYALAEYVHANHTYVAVVPYGTDGCAPMDEKDCDMMRDGTYITGTAACVCGSGDSTCISFMGHVGDNVIVCAAAKRGVSK
jgi:hypothetical protein